MKLVKFKGINKEGNLVRGFFYCENRPTDVKAIVYRVTGQVLSRFAFAIKDEKITMIKCEVLE